MPTGYTADVQDGKITEFADFAMQCARAFGATIMMRDDPADVPIPHEFPPSQHYAEWANKERAKIAELTVMTHDQIVAARDAAEAERAATLAKYSAEKAAQQARYEAMLAKANDWTPPTPDHVEMKKFMVQQLTESIRFDCGHSSFMIDPLPPAMEWHAAQVESAAKSLGRYEVEQRKENERAAGRTAWVKDLRDSLKVRP